MRIELACCVAALASTAATAAKPSRCDRLLASFGNRLADATCFESLDLTTDNPAVGATATTPKDNPFPQLLPNGAFTPTTDRSVIAPDTAHKTPITMLVPGIQLNARMADDPKGQARFLLRLPNEWNGRLVVAGASGTRSEFNGDWAWSDYVLQKGYAYASQNKGVLNLQVTTAADPLACIAHVTPAFDLPVRFYDNEDGQPFTRWASFMAQAAMLARRGVEAHYGKEARRTYAVGTSNGGYQVRRALESFPSLFDGGVDWEGTFVDAAAPNLLTDLPAAVLNFPDYVAGGSNANSTAAKNIRAAGYPPDIAAAPLSLWGRYSLQFWEVTECQWQKRLDPAYVTYVDGTANYNYIARQSVSDVATKMAAFSTTGDIHRPLITVAGTMDGLLPIDHHARAYARKVAAALAAREHGDDDGDGKPAYRLYEVQNGNHIETYKGFFPQLEFIEPVAQAAFDALVAHVEQRNALPSSRCIGRGFKDGDRISTAPAQPGHCANLFVP